MKQRQNGIVKSIEKYQKYLLTVLYISTQLKHTFWGVYKFRAETTGLLLQYVNEYEFAFDLQLI